ncbi:MAG: hypothetical protein LBL20_02945 [Treponema sp.]|jgi:hypothetical protein|nr:hypothetical protein [Treponema sp.]
MGQLDMTLDSLILPNMATVTPAFGTKKEQPKKGLSTLESTLNAMLPFSRMRPFIASENSTTTEIQASSVIVAAGQTTAITLAEGAYIGCGLIVLNTASHTVDVLAGISVFTFDPGEILPLIYMPGGWMRTNHLPPGIVMHSAHNDYALAQERLLPLTGAVLPIADYPSLCRRVYAGDSLNATAPAFYRTSDAEGTVRNTAGQYMTTPNAKGVFLRGSGSQTVQIIWTDSLGNSHTLGTLYDGRAMGEWQSDRIRNILASVRFLRRGTNDSSMLRYASGAFTASAVSESIYSLGNNNVVSDNIPVLNFNPSLVVPTVPINLDNAPGSVSFQICITY